MRWIGFWGENETGFRWLRQTFVIQPLCISTNGEEETNMSTLIKDNQACLDQATELLQTVEKHWYGEPVKQCFSGTVGKHIRHILDHYSCLMAGIASRRIDYDNRQRRESIEIQIEVAIVEIEQMRNQLGTLEDQLDTEVQVKMDTGSLLSDQWPRSTIGRELQFLLSHAVHHYALIGTMCQIKGQPIPETFGIAPSTIKYQSATGD